MGDQQVKEEVIPTCFEQFFTEWHPRIRAIAYQHGFRGVDMEEIVQDTVSFIWAGGYLRSYDPKVGKFSTFINGHARLQMLNRKRELGRRGEREAVVDLKEAMGINDRSYEEMSLIPEVLAANTFLTQTYVALQRYAVTPTRNFAQLFADMVTQVSRSGHVNSAELARQYGYSRQGVSNQIADLLKLEEMKNLKGALMNMT